MPYIPFPHDKNLLIQLAKTKMPFGKHAGQYLTDIPEEYFIWFEKEGYPEGTIGEYMAMMRELKIYDLEHLLIPFQKEKGGKFSA